MPSSFPIRSRSGVASKGVLIARVERGGAAAKAGLHSTRRTSDGDIQWGDLIVAVEGKPVEGVDELLTMLEKHSIGEQVKLTIIRGLSTRQEETLEVTVTLAAESE